MKCDNVKERMSEYLDGMLAGDERIEFESHIAGCASCREDLDSLAKTVELVSGLPRMKAPSRLTGNILASARAASIAEQPAAMPSSRGFHILRAIGAAAVVVIFAAVGYKTIFKDPGTGIRKPPTESAARLRTGTLSLDDAQLDSPAEKLKQSGKELSEAEKDGLDVLTEESLAKKLKSDERDGKGGAWGEPAEEKRKALEGNLKPGDPSKERKAEEAKDAEGGEAPEMEGGRRLKDNLAPSGTDKGAERQESEPAAPGSAGEGRSRVDKVTMGRSGRSPGAKAAPPAATVLLQSRDIAVDVNAVHELLEMAVNRHSGKSPAMKSGGLRKDAADAKADAKEGDSAPKDQDKHVPDGGAVRGDADPRPAQATIEVRLTAAEYARFLERLRTSPEYGNRWMEERTSGANLLMVELEQGVLRRRTQGAGGGKSGYVHEGGASASRPQYGEKGRRGAEPPETKDEPAPAEAASAKPAGPPAPSAPAPTPTPTPTPTPAPAPSPAPAPKAGAAPASTAGPSPEHPSPEAPSQDQGEAFGKAGDTDRGPSGAEDGIGGPGGFAREAAPASKAAGRDQERFITITIVVKYAGRK